MYYVEDSALRLLGGKRVPPPTAKYRLNMPIALPLDRLALDSSPLDMPTGDELIGPPVRASGDSEDSRPSGPLYDTNDTPVADCK